MIQTKALSIHPVPAMEIFEEKKTIEFRTWRTDYRGDLLICSTRKIVKGTIPGHALCVANLADVVPFKKTHLQAAMMSLSDYQKGYAWILDNIRTIRPFKVRGRLSLWDCDHPIEFLDDDIDEIEAERVFNAIFAPLFV